MRSFLALLSILVRENFIPGSLERRPEDSLVMDADDQVEAWHQQGHESGPITPVYHLNTMACNRLAPVGSTVIDLGCGSGQFAAYLARRRTDLRIIGIDLSGPMVETGNRALREAGLGDRVELRQGDMTNFSGLLPSEIGLINCLFALHHLPSLAEVTQCIGQIRDVSEATGCNFILFDLARPRHERTAYDYPIAFNPAAPEAFRIDSINSLVAAYSHRELVEIFDEVIGEVGIKRTLSRLLPVYHAFWHEREAQGSDVRSRRGGLSDKVTIDPPHSVRVQYRALSAILPGFG